MTFDHVDGTSPQMTVKSVCHDTVTINIVTDYAGISLWQPPPPPRPPRMDCKLDLIPFCFHHTAEALIILKTLPTLK